MADQESKYKLVSRKEAMERGLPRFFTAKPCKRGHISQRYTKYNGCCACQKQKTREWRIKNPEWNLRLDRHQKAKDRDKINERYRLRYAANPKKFIEKAKRQYRANGEEIRRKRREWHHANYPIDEELRKEAQMRVRQWAVDNPDKALLQRKVSKQKRRARERGAIGEFSREDLAGLFDRQGGKCIYCNRKLKTKYHADHIVPLSLGGTNKISNIQLLCQPCNLAKAARDPVVHAQSLGLLL